MQVALSPTERAQLSTLIDDLFLTADLETITAKQIRKSLSAQLGRDLSSQKETIQALIIERFDHAVNKNNPNDVSSPTASHNKTSDNTVKQEKASPLKGEKDDPVKKEKGITVKEKKPVKREADSDSDVSPPSKKKRKNAPSNKSSNTLEEDDEKYARMLQAQENRENRGTRAVRGAARGKKKSSKPAVKKKRPNKKSAKKAKDSDESDSSDGSDEGGSKVKEVKKGGFHKEYHLSEPLVNLLGETSLSRPQVVKKIWAYIKAQDLQDPNDKRQIVCDHLMQSVFKQDRVHMCTMNKILSNQLYDIEE